MTDKETNDNEFDGPGSDDALAAEFVLRVLPEPLEEQLALRVETDEAFAALVAHWRERLAALDEDFAEVSPPPSVKSAVDKTLFGAQQPVRQGLLSRLAFWQGLATAACAFALFAVLYPLLLPYDAPDPQPRQLTVATLAADEAAHSFVVVYDRQTARLNVGGRDGAPPIEDGDFELWAIVGDNDPVSLGLLNRDGSLDQKVPEAHQTLLEDEVTIAVSLEPSGGSAGDGPTGPVLSSGALKKI